MDFFAGNDFSMGGIDDEYYAFHSHVPTYYGVQYNHSGGLYLRINRKTEYRVNGPHAFITHPGAFFEYGSIDRQPRQHNFICFYGARIQQYVDRGFLPVNENKLLIKINRPDKFLQSIREIITTINTLNYRHDRAVLMLEDLLLQLHEQDEREKNLPPFQATHFIQLVTRIRKNVQKDWDFEREAARLHITQVHFRRLFKHLHGMPPQQFLIQQRLKLACELLIHSSASVAGIAEKVGIKNTFYFSRIFKKKYSISPLGYRKEFVGQ